MLTLFTQTKNFSDMFFTLKSVMVETGMGSRKFFNGITFFAYEKSMVFIFFRLTLTGTPLTERGDMMDVFLWFQEFQYTVYGDRIDFESFCYLIRSIGLMSILKEL